MRALLCWKDGCGGGCPRQNQGPAHPAHERALLCFALALASFRATMPQTPARTVRRGSARKRPRAMWRSAARTNPRRPARPYKAAPRRSAGAPRYVPHRHDRWPGPGARGGRVRVRTLLCRHGMSSSESGLGPSRPRASPASLRACPGVVQSYNAANSGKNCATWQCKKETASDVALCCKDKPKATCSSVQSSAAAFCGRCVLILTMPLIQNALQHLVLKSTHAELWVRR